MKYRIQRNVGKVRHVVSHWDGVKTHKDGSPFYDVALFSNRKAADKFVKKLIAAGYTL